MDRFISRFESQRQRIWPEVEAFFRSLPPSLKELGWTFAQRLAREVSPTGEFRDAFKDPNVARVVYLPLWHIDAYLRRGIFIPEVEALQAGLFVSSLLGACAIRIYDDLIDADKPQAPRDELLLASLFTVEKIRRLHQLFPSNSLLWDYYTQFWSDYTHAVGVEIQRDRTGLAPFDEAALRHVGNKAALLKTYPVAVALQAGQAHEFERIDVMMDAFNIASQLRNDILGLRRNIESRHYTPPIATAALSCGYEAGTHPPIEGLYGALFMSEAVVETHALALHYYERAREASVKLGIDDLTDYLEWHTADLRESEARWRDIHANESIPRPEVNGDAQPAVVPKAPDRLDMALDFLQHDPECRESWEMQRTGVWGQKSLIGDMFSRSLVLDVLAKQGCAAPECVESLLAQYRQNGWRHYRDFKALPPDIDNVAQVIHLLCRVSWDRAVRQEYLETPLRWLAANRAQKGGFPVWLTEGIDDQPESGWIPLGGSRCIACEANLLTALETYDTSETHEWIAAGVKSLLDRWEAHGYNAVYSYKPPYATFLLARCFACLHPKGWMPADVARRLRYHLRSIVNDIVGRPLSGGEWENPLATASTVLTLLHASEPPRNIISQGLFTLEQQQAYDGGWERVDFFRCPGTPSQGSGWHRGRLLTTAVVTSALAQGRAWLNR